MNLMLLLDLEIKIILFMLKMKKMRMKMMIVMLVVEHLVHMMILISIFFITNETWVLKLSSCLFETLKLIFYLDVMNLFAICHLDEAWVLKLSSCLFETLKLICYLDVINIFAICHLDVNIMTNELIYLVLLKVYYVKDDCFVMLLC